MMKLLFGSIALCLFSYVSLGVKAQTPEDTAAIIEAGVEVYKEVVGKLQEGVKGLFIAEELTKVAKSLAELNIQMEAKQKEALDSILKINVDAQLAIDSARLVVVKLKNICDILIVILENMQDDVGVKIAIETFLEDSKSLSPHVDKAIDRLTKVSAESVKVEAALLILNRWAEVKKEEMSVMTEAQIAAARAKAYGGAAACVAAGPLAFIACPISYAIASGITEGKSVKDIQKAFDGAIGQIDGMRKDITSIGDKTNKLVERVKADKKRMVNIQDQLDIAEGNGRLALKLYDIFFARFKTAVTTLYKSCQDYLAVQDYDTFKLD